MNLMKYIKHGTHVINNDRDGYMYSLNSSDGYDFQSHIHKCIEIIHVFEGELIYTVEDSEYIITSGDIVMTNPGEFHSFRFPKKGTYKREFLHIYPGFLKEYPALYREFTNRTPGWFNRIPASTAEKYGLHSIFNGIREHCAEPVQETDFMIFTYTLQMITKINRIMRESSPEAQHIAVNKTANEVRRYIDIHFNENITLEDIAATVYMSPEHTSRTFRKETGITIKTYITMRRIMRAKVLIAEGHKTTSLFSECGFGDYSTFYRAFVKYAGLTPEEFKRMQNKEM